MHKVTGGELLNRFSYQYMRKQYREKPFQSSVVTNNILIAGSRYLVNILIAGDNTDNEKKLTLIAHLYKAVGFVD